MKIAYAATSKIPSREANSIHVMKMCAAFATEGHGVTLFVPETNEIEPGVDDVYKYYGILENFKIIKTGVRLSRHLGLREYWYSLKAARFIKSSNFDMVYGRDLHLCYISAEIFGKPVFFERHAPILDTEQKIFLKLIKSYNFKKMIVITEALKEYFIEHSQIDADKIYVAPDGADKLPEAIVPAILAAESEGMFHVGYTGHLYKGRGIEFIEQMAKRCPYAFFHIIGGNDEDTQIWKERTEHLSNIHFYGFVQPSTTTSYGMSMDVLIAPYQKEVYTTKIKATSQSTAKWMSPLKIFEYMSMGKPIICSDIPVLREVLVDGVNSILCPCDDVSAWCDAIKKLHDDRELSKQLSENTLRMFEKYTWRQRAHGLINLINSVETNSENSKRVNLASWIVLVSSLFLKEVGQLTKKAIKRVIPRGK